MGAQILSCTTILVDLFAKQVELENSGQLVKKQIFDSEQRSDQKMRANHESQQSLVDPTLTHVHSLQTEGLSAPE